MIKRIVKLTFQPDQIDTFIQIFEDSQPNILAMPGCSHLELWRAVDDSNVLFTYSYWESEDDLNNYRQSDFFKATWAKTKALFAERAEAWSVEVVG
ncbi:MAG: antibiotic biosynthesis monooxygenase family protein [Bacteroidota bacterium]